MYAISRGLRSGKVMDLRKYKDRLRTFGWTSRCNKPLLAREGLYSTGIERQVMCRACHVELDLGKFGRGIMEKHLDKSPDCKLAARRQYLREELWNIRHRDLFMAKEQVAKYPLEEPRVPSMADAARRGYTLEAWKVAGNHNEMTQAGFYWAQAREQVVCYYCGGCFNNEQVQNNSKIQHARGRPKCDYINRCLGADAVAVIQEYYCQEQIPDELITKVVGEMQDVVETKLSDTEDENR